MADTNTESTETAGKGELFFKRAEEVAGTGNWDFAIELYLEGIAREPDSLDRGHKPLRDVSLKRKLQGGKGPGMKDTWKRRASKEPQQNLINAEYLLAKEPGSVAYMERVLQAALKLELRDVALWMCDILMEAQREAQRRPAKPDKRILLLITKTYDGYEEYARALQAGQMAYDVDPNDLDLQQRVNELSAKYTIQKGKYDEEGDFTRSVKDLDKQKRFIAKDRLVQSASYLREQIDQAREQYEQSPDVHGKINALVDALLKIEDESYENEAIDILAKAHRETGAYQFKLRIGDIRIRQMTRRYRKLVEAGDKQAATRHLKEQLQFELEEFAERAANYPTDLALKHELGRRQLLAGKHDEAIASFQQAQRDPRRHLSAMSYLGQAFAAKGWLKEATETYQRALNSEMSEGSEKDLRYNLGDVLCRQERYQEAREELSHVAQMDYNYKDVRKRIEDVEAKLRRQGTD